MLILNDFLPQEYFDRLRKSILTPSMSGWGISTPVERDMSESMGDDYSQLSTVQFTKMFFSQELGWSDDSEVVYELLDALEAEAVFRIKANVTFRTDTVRSTGWHIDMNNPKFKSATVYLNSNDGYTELKAGGRSPSVENSVCIINSNDVHKGTTCTDADFRCVLNVVYSK